MGFKRKLSEASRHVHRTVMISFRPSNVPDYLKGSALFANLSEDDGEVSVPKDCCKLDTSVADLADLIELLRTLRFWGVDRIPTSIVNYVLQNVPEDWDDVLEFYARDLPAVANLIDVIKCDSDSQVCKSVEMGNAEIVSCLLEQNFPTEYTPHHNYYKIIRAVDIAARKGNLEILKLLKQYNCPFTIDTAAAAVLAGQTLCLDYLVKNGCPAADLLLNFAFASGNLECLKYVHERIGCKWTNNIFDALNAHEQPHCDEQLRLQCLEYAQAQGCPNDLSACYVCARHGYVSLLKNLHERGCPWDVSVCRAAAFWSHLHCLQYALENGCPYTDKVFSAALVSDSVEVVQYLYDRGLPWPEDFYNISLVTHSNMVHPCLTYAYQLGFPRDPQTCFYASQFGWYAILVDAHQHGCTMGKECTGQAAAYGHLQCLQYLHEHGCPWDEHTAHDALKSFLAGRTKQDCIKYVVEKGCPMSHDTASQYAKLVYNGKLV